MVVLLIILALILLIFVVPYGIDVIYSDGVLRLGVKLGPFRLWLLPRRPKKPKTARQLEREKRKREKKDAKKRAKKERGEQDETQKVKEKKPFDLDFVLALLKMAVHAIRRFFHSFTVDFLRLHYVVGTPDPYDTAMQYAYIGAALSALPPLAGKVIRVRKSDVLVSADFTAESPAIDARLVLSLQLFKIVHMAVAFAAEFIGWKIKHRRKKDAGATERMDDYGRQQDQRTHGCDDEQDQATG